MSSMNSDESGFCIRMTHLAHRTKRPMRFESLALDLDRAFEIAREFLKENGGSFLEGKIIPCVNHKYLCSDNREYSLLSMPLHDQGTQICQSKINELNAEIELNSKIRNLIWWVDSGHSWLRVSKKELKNLNILDNISSFSFIKNGFAYLEEDLDANIYINAILGKEWHLREDLIRLIHSIPEKVFENECPCRGYERFK